MGVVQERLLEMGIELPQLPKAVANYVPYVVSGNLVVVSGQLPFDGEHLKFKGKVGTDYSLEEGQQAAQLCAMNILAQVREACNGDLDRVKRCLRLGGFVNCEPEFTKHPLVINGASDFMVKVFGEKGVHARAAVGVNSLPLGVAVEVDAMFELG